MRTLPWDKADRSGSAAKGAIAKTDQAFFWYFAPGATRAAGLIHVSLRLESEMLYKGRFRSRLGTSLREETYAPPEKARRNSLPQCEFDEAAR